MPLDKAADFCINLAELPPTKRIEWAHHMIREGETLGHIANRYRTTVAVLRQVNKINGNFIRAGQSLMIPIATRDLSNYTLSMEQRKFAIQNRDRDGSKLVHVVRSGDTLWDISRLYKVSVGQLATWNGMAPRDTLRPGQELVIWHSNTIGKGATGLSLNDSHPLSGKTQRINYVVRKGDSLARISQRFNVKVSQLRRWNSLSGNTYLQPGQRLTLFVDVTRQTENI
jgi:membrane-bound lytic murein transglycosylase D